MSNQVLQHRCFPLASADEAESVVGWAGVTAGVGAGVWAGRSVGVVAGLGWVVGGFIPLRVPLDFPGHLFPPPPSIAFKSPGFTLPLARGPRSFSSTTLPFALARAGPMVLLGG